MRGQEPLGGVSIPGESCFLFTFCCSFTGEERKHCSTLHLNNTDLLGDGANLKKKIIIIMQLF